MMNENIEIIEEIRFLKRKQNCVIKLNDGKSLILSLDLVVKYGLAKGVEIDENLLNEISNKQRFIDAKQTAMNYIAFKPRTEKQVCLKLKDKGFNLVDTANSILFLKEFGYINDENYAISYLKDYLLRKPAGRLKLKFELNSRGINKDLAEKIINEHYPDENKLELAMASCRKKLKIIANKPNDKKKQLLYSHLQRNGFDYDTIHTVLKELATIL